MESSSLSLRLVSALSHAFARWLGRFFFCYVRHTGISGAYFIKSVSNGFINQGRLVLIRCNSANNFVFMPAKPNSHYSIHNAFQTCTTRIPLKLTLLQNKQRGICSTDFCPLNDNEQCVVCRNTTTAVLVGHDSRERKQKPVDLCRHNPWVNEFASLPANRAEIPLEFLLPEKQIARENL